MMCYSISLFSGLAQLPHYTALPFTNAVWWDTPLDECFYFSVSCVRLSADFHHFPMGGFDAPELNSLTPIPKQAVAAATTTTVVSIFN